MNISVTKPINQAFEHMKRVLFKPFDLGKWFTLGFCSFLAQCGRGGGGGNNFNFPSSGGGSSTTPPTIPSQPGSGGATAPALPGSGSGGSIQPGHTPGQLAPTPWDEFLQWLQNLDWATIGFFVALGVVVLIALVLLIVWLGARGSFMFLDGVILNRGAVAEPWKRFRDPAWSLFRFRILLQIVGFICLLLCVGAGLAIAWPDIGSGQPPGTPTITGVMVGGALLIICSMSILIIDQVLHDFVVPIMYLHEVSASKGLTMFRQEILRGHAWPMFLFYVMKAVLAIAMWFMTMIAICLTCCLAALPYLSAVVLLPLAVFSRSYSLYFLQQFGDAWRVFPDQVCLNCGYDLRGSTGQPACPECGTPTPQEIAIPIDDAPPMPPPPPTRPI